jgi:hypothetical protein
VLGGLAHEPLALVGERDDRRGRAVAFEVDEDLGLVRLPSRRRTELVVPRSMPMILDMSTLRPAPFIAPASTMDAAAAGCANAAMSR